MAQEHFTSIGAEYRKEIQRIEPKLLFFGAILLMSHVLDISPSDFDAGGIKIAIRDVAVIHGGLALVFLYYFWSLMTSAFQGSALLPIAINRRVARHLLSVSSRRYRDEKTKRMVKRSPKGAKRLAWWWITAFNLFMTPFMLVATGVVVGALLIGFQDTYVFGEYLWDQLVRIEDQQTS